MDVKAFTTRSSNCFALWCDWCPLLASVSGCWCGLAATNGWTQLKWELSVHAPPQLAIIHYTIVHYARIYPNILGDSSKQTLLSTLHAALKANNMWNMYKYEMFTSSELIHLLPNWFSSKIKYLTKYSLFCPFYSWLRLLNVCTEFARVSVV